MSCGSPLSRPVPPREPYTLVWAIVWLAVLAPLFFISYGWSNQLASELPNVPSFHYAWETRIPLLAWTIVPYWSIDLLYGLAFLFPKNKKEVHTLGKRLLLAQLICVTFFVFLPLQFSWDRPVLEGFFGHWFDLLMQFDKPFNQAPSLHIVLLVVLWETYAKGLQQRWSRGLLHGWFTLIALSVLTTWQHHFIDLLTGVWVGCFCLWCISGTPHDNSYAGFAQRKRIKLAGYYGLGAGLLALLAGQFAIFSLAFLLLLWFSLALALVALIYLLGNPQRFGKQQDGHLQLAHRLLLSPYFWGARINQFLWNRGQPLLHSITPAICIGSLPQSLHDVSAVVVDVCAELPYASRQPASNYRLFPLLDLCVPPPESCCQIAAYIEDQQRQGLSVHIYCALGRGRSVFCTAAWLLLSARFQTVEAAIAHIQEHHPKSVVSLDSLVHLSVFVQDPKYQALYQQSLLFLENTRCKNPSGHTY